MTTKYKEPIQEFINRYWTENCRPPTVREIAEELGGISTSVVNYSLEHDLGYKNKVKGESRWIVPEWVRRVITAYQGDKNDDTKTTG